MSDALEKPEWLVQTGGVLEALNEGVLVLDDCNRILFANEVLVQMTGFPLQQILAREPGHFYRGADLEFLNKQIARGEQAGQHRYEFYVPRADGGRVAVVVSSRIIEDPDGRRFVVVTFTDITEQKRAEEQLRHANVRLEERQREIEKELALAARVQQSLAPQNLQWGRVAVETYYVPVRTIGGDFGVVAPSGNGHLNLLVCDVSGHGISSALLANRIYSETASLLESRVTLDEVLRRLNRFVLQQIRLSGFFFSLAAARIEAEGRQAHFAAAGHPPAFWLSPAGECRRLDPRSTVLGALDDAVAPEASERIELSRGDRLVLYTDGLTDVFDQRDEILGVEGLEDIVHRAARTTLPEMKSAIVDQVAAWRHGPPTDDMSLVLLEVR